jgi:hypothetical protein
MWNTTQITGLDRSVVRGQPPSRPIPTAIVFVLQPITTSLASSRQECLLDETPTPRYLVPKQKWLGQALVV